MRSSTHGPADDSAGNANRSIYPGQNDDQDEKAYSARQFKRPGQMTNDGMANAERMSKHE
jgi:hypothetical protein